MTRGWMRIGAAMAPAVLLAGVLSAAPLSASPTAGAGRARPIVGGTDGRFARSDSVLSPRLSQLVSPTWKARSATEQSEGVGLPASGAGSLLSGDSGLVVMIGLTDTSDATQHALTVAGATIGAIDPTQHRIEASVPADKLVSVGSVAGVQSVHEELTPKIAGRAAATSPAAAQVAAAAPVCNPVVTEGDVQLRATTARATYGLDGAGVKVGILSDSYDRRGGAGAGIASGNLPGPGNPCGHGTPVQVLQEQSSTGGNDEGRAMAEIVHDVAPEATLMFASAMNGELGFANNIRSLAAAGAKVIVDDVGYLDEPAYQDGDVGKAVADVAALGVTYYSAAGNENILDQQDRDVSSYEGAAYRPTTCPVLPADDLPAEGYDCHDFDPGGGVSNGDTITVEAGEQLIMTLSWNEPEYGIVTDLAFLVIDTTANEIIAGSDDPQDNSIYYKPFEAFSFSNQTSFSHTYKVVVLRNVNHPGGTPKFKFITWGYQYAIDSVQFPTTSGGDVIGPSILGHSAPLTGASVGAVPYTPTISTAPEDYSSRGPATYCWAPITGTTSPAAALPSCQTKPLDFVATDGGLTSFFAQPFGPFWRFYGTSAAAPHAAAVGALMLDARPCATPAQILAAQRSTARPVGSYGVGAVGSGLIDANAAVGALATCPTSTGARYHPVAPKRILESRNIVGNTGGYTTPWGAGTVRSLDVTNTNSSGVPDTGVSAVVLNVTVTNTTQASFLTVFPNGDPVPIASNLNWPAGTTIANLVTVKVGTGGMVNFFNQNGNVDVIADVVGWYDADAGAHTAGGTLYTPTTPTRILESRNIVGNTGGYTTPWGGGTTRVVDVVGASQHPVPAGATAVVLNVTAVTPSVGGFLTVFPADVTTTPTASNVNWKPLQIIPNLVTVKLGVGAADVAGKIKIFNAAGTVDVVADVVGYYGADGGDVGSAFHTLSPTRILESRFANGNLQGQWTAGQTRNLDVTDTHGSGVPAGGVTKAVIMNVTVTGTDDAGFLTLFPASQSSPPTASNLNWSKGDTVPNLTITKVDTSGSDNVKIFNQRGNTYVIADVVGWFG